MLIADCFQIHPFDWILVHFADCCKGNKTSCSMLNIASWQSWPSHQSAAQHVLQVHHELTVVGALYGVQCMHELALS